MLAPNISPPTPEAHNFSETHSSQYLRLVIKNKQKYFCQLLAKMYEVGSLGYLVTNLVKNFVTNLVMNLVNHRIW